MTTTIKIPPMSFPEHVAALDETLRSLCAAFAESDSLAALVLAREAVVGFESLLADLKETIEDRHRETVAERWDRLVLEGGSAMNAKPHPPIGSPEEMRARFELREKLQTIAAGLWSEQLRELIDKTRLMRLMGYPLPRDSMTILAIQRTASGRAN